MRPILSDLSANDVTKNHPTFPIVGIGASAGGLEAFTTLLKTLPVDTGMAFVIIQHLDPNHSSYLREALSKTTAMPVLDIIHGLILKPNQVYVLPSNVDLEISACELKVIPRIVASGVLHMPINTFLTSLAKNCERRAIGIVLTGNGNDGTEGLRAIKNEGGFTFAQDPSTAKYSSMPESAVLAGIVDFSLPLDKLAEQLSHLSGHPYYFEKEAEIFSDKEDEQNFEKILLHLRKEQKVDFNEYKDATVKRRLIRRMAFLRIESLKDYFKILLQDPNEPHALVEDILIHVTSFFRDPEAFEKLKENVFPQITKNRTTDAPIRIWVAGCSTGEEVYSLVICLLEFLGDSFPKIPIQVFGSDISERMIEKSRAGFYTDSSVKELKPERLKRFFTKVEHGYRINKTVRDLCVFVRHDLARDPPFSRLDLITCRNVLIYFDKPLQRRLFSTFHYCLKQPGFLLLGRTENVSGHHHFFSTEDKINKIFLRAPIESHLRFQMPAEANHPRFIPTAKIIPNIHPVVDLSKSIDNYLLSEYAPCGVLINERMDVLQFRGRTSDFLEQPPGEPEDNLFKMVKEGLFVELQMAIAKAKKELKVVRTENVRVKSNETSKLCNIIVRPLTEPSQSKEIQFLILFEEVKGSASKPALKSFFSRSNKKELLDEELRSTKLEKELEVTKEYLQSLNDQHQKSNDALATANEEFVSGNEELQSMNEELETAKEELQSINEELTTVNDELQSTNQELGQVNNDLINLLNSVQIPIVILDVNRRIRRYTPHARSIMNLLPTDIGRSIDDIKLNLVISDLDKQIAEAVATDKVKESEVQDHLGSWFRIQIRPYKTLDNKVEGTVISLFDINILRNKANVAEWGRDYATSIVEGIQVPLVVLDKNLMVISANKAFYSIFNVTRSETENNLLYDLGINQWDIPLLTSTLGEILSKKTSFQNAEVEREFPGLGKRTMSLSARAIYFDAKVSDMILLSMEDITIRKNQEAEKGRLLLEAINAKKEAEEASKQLRIIADSVPIHLIHLSRDEKFLFVNKAAAKMWGQTIDHMVGKSITEIAGPEAQAELAPYTKQVLAGKTLSYESPFTTPSGETLTFLNTYTPDIDSEGTVNGFVATGTDITDRMQMEEELRSSLHNLAMERELRDRFVSALSHDLRTPLTVAKLGAEMIIRKISDPVQLHKISDKIIKNMQRADGMIRDLLDANRLKAGEKLHLSIEKTDLVSIVQEVIDDLKSLHGNRFILKGKEIITGYWDREALRRMVENLASNGIKYGRESEAVTIQLELKNNSIEISVSNKGSPILPEDQKNIFEPFQRSENAAKGAYEGWGIGLTLVRGLARAHGGDVTLTSNESEGTSFKITLPLDARKFAT